PLGPGPPLLADGPAPPAPEAAADPPPPVETDPPQAAGSSENPRALREIMKYLRPSMVTSGRDRIPGRRGGAHAITSDLAGGARSATTTRGTVAHEQAIVGGEIGKEARERARGMIGRTLLDRYRLEELVAMGGIAAVFRAKTLANGKV